MVIEKSSDKLPYFLLTYLILWVVLFEFILPVNNIFPKPSIVFETFPDLWDEYNLPLNFISTISAVYVSLILAYFFVWFLSSFLIKKDAFLYNFILSLEWFGEYIPGIILGIFLIYWFPDSIFIEYIFAFLVSFFSISIFINKEYKESHYTDSAKSFGLSEKIITEKVAFKLLQPKIFNHLLELHFYLWTLILIFEYIKNQFGIGVIYRKALEFDDLSALFSNSIITGITIYAGYSLIKFFKNKFFSWSGD